MSEYILPFFQNIFCVRSTLNHEIKSLSSDIMFVGLDFIRHMIKHFRSLQSPQKCCILLPQESANHIGKNSNSQNMKLTGGGGFRGGIAVD